MYWKAGQKMPEKARLVLPNGKFISARKMAKKWPEFASEMDGSSAECSLSWYYKLEGECFVFKGSEEEDEIAEILNVPVGEVLETLDDSTGSSNGLTVAEIAAFKSQLTEIKEALVEHYKN